MVQGDRSADPTGTHHGVDAEITVSSQRSTSDVDPEPYIRALGIATHFSSGYAVSSVSSVSSAARDAED
ncbi:hypothetical protein JCM24511_00346 [Saitozyma sp. JCM 24511]|nr:hypothetical protein JCM24511_00346 [Saitozyma sp. JCM 24511]